MKSSSLLRNGDSYPICAPEFKWRRFSGNNKHVWKAMIAIEECEVPVSCNKIATISTHVQQNSNLIQSGVHKDLNRMSAVGFDIGNENCAIAVAKHGSIDMLLNEESKRETPAVVAFGEKQRFFGSSGAAFASTNPKLTISQIKRLIGRLYKEPSVQKDLQLLPFDTSEGPNGGILIHLEYLKEKWTFMPVEILGMLFAHLKKMTEKNLGSPVSDCVIGIPSYFTDFQRREYLSAASMAGLRPLKLMHDCTAIALGYGIYNSDFSNLGPRSRPTNVMFVDIGHSDTQVTIVAFEKGKMTILSHSFDQNLGGRDFDEVLFRHFAAKFKENYNLDVCLNARASRRLRACCEKLKKVLSANAEAPLSIESLIDDKDVNGFITREEFERLSLELLQRITVVCSKAGIDSRLSANEIDIIELVGSGTYIPAIMRKLYMVFGKEPMRTLNGSECVARGCALQCAMLSPIFSPQDYKVQDIIPYSIEGCFLDGNRERPEFTPFPKGTPFPSNKQVPYHGHITSYCHFFYTNNKDIPVGLSPDVGLFLIGPSQPSGIEKVLVKVKVHLNIHGIVEIESASIIEDKHSSSKRSRFPTLMKMAKSLTDRQPIGSSAHSAEEARRGSTMRQNLEVSENMYVVMSKNELRDAQEIECLLADRDTKVEQTKEIRNTLESFIYETRGKLSNTYRSVITVSEEKMISKSLQETEKWLNGEGDDVSLQVYIGKLEYLGKVLDPFESRYKDELAKKEATKALEICIQENRLAADSLPLSQQKEVNNECIQAEQWFSHLSQFQDSLPKNATRMYCSSAINEITQVLKGRCKDIMTSKPSSAKNNGRKQNPDDMQVEN
ncbi:hypothetical protein LXL04_027083 [Taraxacum kok-saghyz]